MCFLLKGVVEVKLGADLDLLVDLFSDEASRAGTVVDAAMCILQSIAAVMLYCYILKRSVVSCC